jgi:hypothetical protein
MSDFYCVRCDAEREEDCECGDLRISKPTPSDIIPAQLIQDLWGIGFTITTRVPSSQIYDVANGLVLDGMTYAWRDDPQNTNWKCVPASHHPGLFAPYGYTGDIEVNGLWLMERPKAEVDAFHADTHAKARQNVDDWFQRQAASGFTGGVTVLEESSGGPHSAEVADIGAQSVSLTKIPHDLFGHLPELMAERDRLIDAERDGDWQNKPPISATLKDNCLKQAIENIRTRLATEGAQQHEHEQSTESGQGNPAGASSPPASGPTSEG